MQEKSCVKTQPRRTAFIGLGVMGYPMAGHLLKAGHEVTVYNRTRAKAERWVREFGGRMAGTPRQAAAGADIVFACVGNDDDLRSVILGPDGALAGMKPGSVFVDNTTDSADVAREMAQRFASSGCGFVDAPVSGGQSGAEEGVLTVMCGGSEDDFARVCGAIGAYACAVTLMGGPGSGQLTKMVNQICISGLLQALSEGIAFGMNAGLDMEKVMNVISRGAAGSWQMQARGLTMVEGRFDFGFAVDWMRKDLAIALREAARNGSSLPVAALVDSFYAKVQAAGGGRLDTSSLISLLPRPGKSPE